MTIADSRVVERPEFTVADALMIADQNADAYDKVASVSRTLAAEVRSLQSRLDAVVAAVAKHRDTFPDEALPSELELWESIAALGCATTGEMK